MDWRLIAASVAIFWGIFFTHRIFVVFILELLRTKKEIEQGGMPEKEHLAPTHLLMEAVQIALGIIPLVWGIATLIKAA